MILFKKAAALTTHLQQCRTSGASIGFVPTMGALHQGHISLIMASAAANPVTVVSIFVNPAQFNDPKDFEKYPVTLEKDLELLAQAGASIVFLPSVAEIYPDGLSSPVHYDLGRLEQLLEGKYRPGHFQGVCRVMDRLLRIVGPAHLYMGQKDYQQCMVVERLIKLLNLPVQLHTCPTLREADGLAMSSRNTRLDERGRQKATGISAVLRFIQRSIAPGATQPLVETSIEMLEANDFRVDYVSIADAQTLEPVQQWNGRQPLVALVAAFQREVRLIDNMTLS
jgi:pantoate--beta-alanine ligase